jgi:hypothetical protein
LYDWTCKAHGQFEALAGVNDERIVCRAEGCKKKAKRIFVSVSGIGEARNAQGFSAPLVWKNADGSYTFAGSSHETAPEGAERVDLRTMSEIRNFERHMNDAERSKHNRSMERQQEVFEARRSMERSDLRQRMQSMSPAGRAFAQFAIQRGNDVRSKLYKTYEPGCHFKVFSDDRSNRNGERSERTGFRERKE